MREARAATMVCFSRPSRHLHNDRLLRTLHVRWVFFSDACFVSWFLKMKIQINIQ